MTRGGMTPADARHVLGLCRVPLGADFHTLDSETVESLLQHADAWRYRKPRNANGSRGRYWHARLDRLANRKES
jgi:hypothetical protein